MILKKIFVLLALMVTPFLVTSSLALGMGMGMGMGPPTPCGGPFPPCPVPLDKDIWLLLIAGLAYGGYKLYKSFKKNPA
jgi:hypothetical protein